MRVRSLALTTELGLLATRGTITDRGGYLVVATPGDPDYHDGNLLVLPAPPQVGEVAYWTRRFAAELGEPAVVTLRWDGVTGDLGAADELRAAGFTLEVSQVMTAAEVLAPPPVATPRPLAADEVLATADLGWAIADRHDEPYRRFLQRRAAWHADLVARGTARFWGIFDGGALVASLGLVRLGALARYQDVQTAPALRRRGFASALVAAAAAEAFDRGVERVVIVTEPGSRAARLYAQLGLVAIEQTAAARRRPA